MTKAKLLKILSYSVLAISIFVAICTIISAYAGYINPYSFKIAPLLCMSFPYWIIASLIMIVITFFVRKIYALIPSITLLLCINPILQICPLNLFSFEDEDDFTFTLLSYNAYNFIAFNNENPSNNTNATLNYIAETDADVVCLQECEYLSHLPSRHVYEEQVAEIKKQYPHHIIGVESGQSILSKYPVEEVYVNEYFSHFIVEMPNGRNIDIINVHLKSIPLTAKDKRQYNDALSSNENEDNSVDYSSLRNIMSKVANAAKQRAHQAHDLQAYISTIGNENIIVCGDFNDVPCCYAINTITDDDFDDAYAECGFGPMTTYHGNNINVRIDHVFYKGDLEATSFDRGDVKCSDHYPLLVTFQMEND